MFQKQTFGGTNTGFGSFNAGASTTSPFSGFKPTTGTSAFGAPPAFGANSTTQPTTGGGLFGATNTSSGLFGGNPTTSTFGTTSGFGFGANTTTGGGLFSSNTSGGSLFGNNQTTTGFGAKPAGFGFGATTNTATTGLFGSTPSTSTGLFGQQNNTIGSGNLFGNTSGGFGQQQATGTAHVKYNPVVGTDVVVKGGTAQNVNIKHHCITCMKEYETKSLEELRLEDYVAGRKGASGAVFGGFQQTENKPLFGGSSFGQPATTSAPSLFGTGIGTTPAFGQTSTFSFGNTAQNNTSTTGLFGANKPSFGATSTGTGLFGATTTQTPTFGTNTSTFGFGTNTQNQTSGNLFGAKTATTGFGATPASTGFGTFGSSGLFGAKQQTTTAPTFGSTAPTFGATSGFGTNTTGSSLFGGGGFGKPPTTQTSFSFSTQPALGTGLGSSFQNKPTTPAFGTLGTMGTGSLFQQPAQNNTFRTGLDSGLGGGLFGNNSTLGGSALGSGQLNANSMGFSGALGTSFAGNVHEQILSLAARPYGDTPLFKDLLPDSSYSADDALKATNPSAVKAVLQGATYRVASPPNTRLMLAPRPVCTQDKKSLFDGLEESDASLEDKLSLKPSRKRLVLRPNRRSDEDSVERQENNGSMEEPSRNDVNSQDVRDAQQREDYASLRAETMNQRHFNENNNVDSNSERNVSWMETSKQSWTEKEKPIDGEPTPRLYPNLDKELPAQVSERRASWLTTKPIRRPLVSNPDLAVNSVLELGGRPERASDDKENYDTLSVSEEENAPTRELPPHPAGVKLTRPGYYTIPSLEEITNYMRPDGTCIVPHLTIGRKNYGNVYYDCEIDVAGLDLDALVHFLNKEVIIYPDDEHKPPVGEGLNRRAVITLERVWPRDKTEKRPVTEPERLLKMDYEGKLRRVCDKHDTKFIEYRPQTGSWVFRVEHFSKYGLTDSDEDDDVTPEVLKRQLVNQALQKSSAQAQNLPPTTTAAVGLGGVGTLGGLGGLGGLSGLSGHTLGGPSGMSSDDMFAIQQSSLSLMNGSARAFELDSAEDNSEAPSLYQDNRALGVKSPTSELARLEHRSSHHVQLMKASLYADTEMEDDTSQSTGDQLVPRVLSAVVPARSPPRLATTQHDPEEDEPVATISQEIVMQPLIVRPHTIILNYHRKVPPFKHTIAGRLGAACIADMSVCRARHARASFGPGGAMAYVTTYDAINDLPKVAELSALGSYVSGRGEDDWSVPIVATLAVGQTGSNTGQDILSRQLTSLLEFSVVTDTDTTRDVCPRLVVRDSPSERRQLLRRLLNDASNAGGSDCSYGVSYEYSLQVWKLCEALWGADLDNDGVPGTDEQSIVNRHKRLLEWLEETVSDITDKELAETRPGEPEDESDGHSARVWSLVVGGRVREACRVARGEGDLHMAALLAQAADPAFKSLMARQLRVWQECGAHALIASSRLATLHLLAGLRPRERLDDLDWLRAFSVTARYLTPQVPSLEQIIRTYEGFFPSGSEGDLSSVADDEMGMQFPTPPYSDQYSVTAGNGRTRRVLDLRYELLRARAFNTRPKLSPASYTPDPFDYSLSFLMNAWLGAPLERGALGAAEQLEARGAWHLAVVALAYHPDDVARSHLIRRVISRHAPSQADTPEMRERLQLLTRIGIPEHWILLAQADRAKYEHKPALEVGYLVRAQQWNAAHKVLLKELLPDAVLADNLESIKDILEKMSKAADRHEVSGWENGGQALYHYLRVCDEIRGLVSSAGRQAGGAVSTRLEALRPELAAACRALRGLTADRPRARAARAEMGARLAQLALAGGQPPPHLAALLAQLRLPPDCAARAAHTITTDLAERASELCLDSEPTSPLSEHRRPVES